MANAKRDDNKVPVALAESEDGTTEPLRVDPATSYLLVDVARVDDNGIIGSWPSRSPRDDNRIPIIMGETDDVNATPTPLRIDRRNGYLFVDLIELT